MHHRTGAIGNAPRARDVQSAVLAEFGRAVGASERTLARIFVRECGMTFGTWRTRARLRAALPLLAAGKPLATIAAEVGNFSPSAFVVAFRRAVGVTPGAYFADPALVD